MSLEINKNDSSFDTRELSKKKVSYQRTIAGLLVLMTLFSGSLLGPTKVYAAETAPTSQSQNYVDPSTVIEIPEEHQYTVADLCGKEKGEPITIADLNSITDNWLTVPIYDGANLEWLNYVGNIEYASFIIHAEDTSIFRTIKKLGNVKKLSITSAVGQPFEMNATDFAFIKNSKNTKELLLSGEIGIEPGFLESLTHLKKLTAYLQDANHTYDCSKLTFLDELKLYEPYTAAVYVTQEEYDFLTRNGVKVTFTNDEELATFKEINKKLDEIVDSLNVDENSSDQEKLDAILCYVLDNLTYDEGVSNAIQNNESFQSLAREFYHNGLLYGAIEMDTAICGNYAALTNALAERLNLDSYYLTSHDHAWSLVEVEGEQYYVDSTWLDGSYVYKKETTYKYDELGNVIATSTSWTPIEASEAIKEGNTEELEWYMEEPSSYPKSESQSESHIVVNLPSFLNINPQEETDEIIPEETQTPETTPPLTETLEETGKETKPIVLDGEEVEVRLGDKKWIIPAAAAIGVLTAIGGAVAIKKNKEKKERERRRRQAQYDNMFGDYSSPYGTTYTYNNPYDTFEDDFYGSSIPSSNNKNTSRRRR